MGEANARSAGRILVGTSGWSYRDWRGPFYPPQVAPRDELAFASRVFDAIEINRTFYRLATPDAHRHWYEVTPPDFRFAIKGHKFVTHNKKLADTETALANVLASGVLELREKLGAILWQLPYALRFDPARVEAFFRLLPADTEQAARLAVLHDPRVVPQGATRRVGDVRPLHHVLEPRHPSWFTPELADLARRHGVAIANSDASTWPSTEEVTADLVYLRLHGPGALYASAYDDDQLGRLAERAKVWAAGSQPPDAHTLTGSALPPRPRDVYLLFDNDVKAIAPAQARRLLELLGRG